MRRRRAPRGSSGLRSSRTARRRISAAIASRPMLAAAVHDHRDFRRKREPGLAMALAKRRGDCAARRSALRDRRAADRRAPARRFAEFDVRALRPPRRTAARDGAKPADLDTAAGAEISMMPLPCARGVAEPGERRRAVCGARRHEPRQQARRRSPSAPTAPGQAPRAKVWLIAPPPPRARQCRRRDRCGADATVPCAAPPRAARRSLRAAAGFSRSRNVAHRRVGEIGFVHQIEQRARRPRRSSRRNRPAGRRSRPARRRRARRGASARR